MTIAEKKQAKIPFIEKEFNIRVSGFNGDEFVSVPGFAYGDTGLGYRLCECGEGYVVTHIPSGYKVVTAHFRKNKVQPFVKGLAAFTDFTVEKPKFNESKKDQYFDLIAQYQIFTNWDH